MLHISRGSHEILPPPPGRTNSKLPELCALSPRALSHLHLPRFLGCFAEPPAFPRTVLCSHPASLVPEEGWLHPALPWERGWDRDGARDRGSARSHRAGVPSSIPQHGPGSVPLSAHFRLWALQQWREAQIRSLSLPCLLQCHWMMFSWKSTPSLPGLLPLPSGTGAARLIPLDCPGTVQEGQRLCSHPRGSVLPAPSTAGDNYHKLSQ